MLSDAEQDALTVEHPDAGRAPARPCFDICLFYDQPRSDLKQGLPAAFDEFISRSQGGFGWFKTNVMKSYAKAQTDASTMVASLLASPEFDKPGDVGIGVHSGTAGADLRTPAFSFFSEQSRDERGQPIRRTFLRLCLPPSSRRDGRALFDLAAACAGAQAFHCGYAGYSWYWSAGDTRMERALGQRKGLLLRHPAMVYHDPFTFQPFVGQGLMQVGWLTFVGASLLSRLGERRGAALDEATQVGVSALGEGMGGVFVAGAEPMVGSRLPADAAQLAPYREVGRRLAALRLPDSAIQFLDLAGFDDEDDVRAWYLRFFGEE